MTEKKPALADALRIAAQPKPAAAYVPPSRRGRKVFPLYLDLSLWRRFKLAALERDVSMQALAVEAIEKMLAEHVAKATRRAVKAVASAEPRRQAATPGGPLRAREPVDEK